MNNIKHLIKNEKGFKKMVKDILNLLKIRA